MQYIKINCYRVKQLLWIGANWVLLLSSSSTWYDLWLFWSCQESAFSRKNGIAQQRAFSTSLAQNELLNATFMIIPKTRPLPCQ